MEWRRAAGAVLFTNDSAVLLKVDASFHQGGRKPLIHSEVEVHVEHRNATLRWAGVLWSPCGRYSRSLVEGSCQLPPVTAGDPHHLASSCRWLRSEGRRWEG